MENDEKSQKPAKAAAEKGENAAQGELCESDLGEVSGGQRSSEGWSIKPVRKEKPGLLSPRDD